jgi:hypothetical protein
MPKSKEQMLERCRNRKDFLKVANKFDADVWEATNHTVVETDLGRTHIGRHPGDIPKGTQRSIYKALMIILATLSGITLLVLEAGKSLPPAP